MEERILKILIQKHNQSGGNCGVRITKLKAKLNIDFPSLKQALNKLYKSKKITVHPSAQGRMVKINENQQSQQGKI